MFNFNGSKIVKAAVRKYKISEFAFIILELYPERVTIENNQKIIRSRRFRFKVFIT